MCVQPETLLYIATWSKKILQKGRDRLQKDADITHINNSVVGQSKQTCFISPNELKHLSASGHIVTLPASLQSSPLESVSPTSPSLWQRFLSSPALCVLSQGVRLSRPQYMRMHTPSVSTICQLPSGHQPGAGHVLTPAMPQQHCLLGSGSPCQLLIIMSSHSRPETHY